MSNKNTAKVLKIYKFLNPIAGLIFVVTSGICIAVTGLGISEIVNSITIGILSSFLFFMSIDLYSLFKLDHNGIRILLKSKGEVVNLLVPELSEESVAVILLQDLIESAKSEYGLVFEITEDLHLEEEDDSIPCWTVWVKCATSLHCDYIQTRLNSLDCIRNNELIPGLEVEVGDIYDDENPDEPLGEYYISFLEP